jgi:hypothetical protein
VEGILMTINRQAQTAIENTQIGIATQTYTKVETAVLSMRVIPVSIVGIAITGGGMGQCLSRLMNGIIVEFG